MNDKIKVKLHSIICHASKLEKVYIIAKTWLIVVKQCRLFLNISIQLCKLKIIHFYEGGGGEGTASKGLGRINARVISTPRLDFSRLGTFLIINSPTFNSIHCNVSRTIHDFILARGSILAIII